MRKLIESFISAVLLESRRDDLKKKYSAVEKSIEFDDIWQQDPSPTKKYVEWMLKQVRFKQEKQGDYISNDWYDLLTNSIRFFNDNNKKYKFKSKDINFYKTLEDLSHDIERVKTSGPTNTERRKGSSAGAVRLYESDIAVLYRIDTKDAARKLGHGTKWCITMENANYYEKYSDKGAYFYYVIKKEQKGQDQDKIAISIIKFGQDIEGEEFYTASDTPIDERAFLDAVAGDQNFINIAREDASSKPPKVSFLVEAGWDVTPAQAAEYWSKFKTDDQKINALLHKIPVESYQNLLPVVEEKYKEILTYYELSSNTGRLVLKRKYRYDSGDRPTEIGTNGVKLWKTGGLLDRENGPAVVSENGEQWLRDGELHREDGPAVIQKNGTKKWYRHGNLHRKDGPAVIEHDSLGRLMKEEWFQYGKMVRPDGGPTVILYNRDKIVGKEWRDQYGSLIAAPDGGPSKIFYEENGNVVAEEWWKDGNVVYEKNYNKDGTVSYEWGKKPK